MAVNKVEVAIKYAFDLALCDVRGKVVSEIFKGVHMFQACYL